MLARTQEQERVYEIALKGNYGVSRLLQRIYDDMSLGGKNVQQSQQFTRDDMAYIDEFHVKQRDATRDLMTQALQYLGHTPSKPKVLDLGCGIGGPCRTIADEFGCDVIGVDAVPQNIEVAKELTNRTKFSENAGKVEFMVGMMTEIPQDIKDDSIDIIICQDALVNVENKTRVFGEAKRVLKSHGVIAIQDIFVGPVGGVILPVAWAHKNSINFPEKQKDVRQSLTSMSFEELAWFDKTQNAIDWLKNVASPTTQSSGAAAGSQESTRQQLGMKLLLGDNWEKKINNTLRNFQEKRCLWCTGIFRCPFSSSIGSA